ncbi:hypothetical protein N7535_009322 [Penicillium sp. DV-2018c]|nr:hypothetical protein N7461_002769 [Penicillium sp. DV-2018c]KAJ5561125.1 hypothetical protein N7535_009322 [Penicillium sp. DV-2018c]
MDLQDYISPVSFTSIHPASVKCRSLPSILSLEMSDDSGVQFMGARTKPTQRHMAAENERNGEAAWQDHFHPPPSAYEQQPSNLPPRTHRHGYDYRRPVMLSPQEDTVIDLTNEDEDSPQETRPPYPGPLHSTHPRRRGIESPRDLMNRESVADDHPPVIDLEAETPNDPNEDVLYVRTTSIRPSPIEPMWLDDSNIPIHYRPTQRPRPRRPGHGLPRRSLMSLRPIHDDILALMTSMPRGLDYAARAFAFSPPTQPASEPPQNRYKAPSPVPEGFTRVLSEDNVPTCPNCEEELGVGEGLKQEIHVAKPCGHVYCGECARNRSISKSKKAASKSKPFSKCQAPGCDKTVSPPRAMYQVFL